MAHNEDRSVWTDQIPTIHDLYQYGGRPGCEYLYCDLAHLIEATQAGWHKINNAPTFRLIGPKGTGDFELLERGTPALHITPHASAQPVSISEYLCAATGLGTSGEFAKIPVSTPSTEPLAPSLGQPARVTKETQPNA